MNFYLRYHKGTFDHRLMLYKSDALDIIRDIDTDWVTCLDNNISTGSYCICMKNSLVSWNSKKHKVLTKSSTRVEYRALIHAIVEVTWIQKICTELHIQSTHDPLIFCDNMSVRYLDKRLIIHSCTKHIEIDFHFVKEKVTTGDSLCFTKPLSSQRFDELVNKLVTFCRP